MNNDDGQQDLRGSDAVFGLIGSPVAGDGGRSPVERDGTRSVADDLISTLHQQYWRALNDPSAVFPATEWVMPGDTGGLTMPLADGPDQAQADAWSIEELLEGRISVDTAFGPLGTDDNLKFAADEPIPEILRLFAPPEFHAARSRRPPDLPPPLTRREHHVLSASSPMSMLFRPPVYGERS